MNKEIPLTILRDDANDTITINGICYSQQIFRDFGNIMPLGEKFSIISRDNGVLSIKHYREQNGN